MKTIHETMAHLGKLFAKTALKVGVSSVNSVCRFGYYQNKVPHEMEKIRK